MNAPVANEPLRIGLLTGEFPPMHGGVGAYTEALGKALAAAGHSVTVLTHREARPAQAERRIGRLREPVDLGWGRILPRLRRFNWSEMSLIADAAVRFDLDLINIQFQPAAYNMRNPAIYFLPWRLRGVAHSVVTFHDLRLPYLFPKAGGLRNWVVRRLAQSANGVVATNSADFHTLAAWRNGANVVEIPIGSNITARAADPAAVQQLRNELGVKAGACVIGYFGFLNRSKGADALIEAAGRLMKENGAQRRLHVLFIGGLTGASDRQNNAAFLAEVQQMIAAQGISDHVHWTGFVPDEQVSAYLHACDLMVMPYRDGASLRRGTLMACLAHGRPIITTEPPALTPGLVHGETCLFVDAAAPDILAGAIKNLLADPALRTSLAAGAARAAQQFTWPVIAERNVAFFRKIMSG